MDENTGKTKTSEQPVRQRTVFVAVVDDEADVCRALRRLLSSVGFDCETFTSGGDFLQSLGQRQPDCLLLDWYMLGLTGLDVLLRLRHMGQSLPVVVMTGKDEPGVSKEASVLGTTGCLVKPVNDQELFEMLAKATKHGVPCEPPIV